MPSRTDPFLLRCWTVVKRTENKSFSVNSDVGFRTTSRSFARSMSTFARTSILLPSTLWQAWSLKPRREYHHH